MNQWNEVIVVTASPNVDTISNLLLDLGSTGIAIEDISDISETNLDGFGSFWDQSIVDTYSAEAKVKGYFDINEDLSALTQAIHNGIQVLKDLDLFSGTYELELKTVKDDDWENKWQDYYLPQSITRYLTIVPPWSDYQAAGTKEQLIYLNPGMAFGTGSHETTYLSLELLEKIVRLNDDVLDVGTGSGILAFAAKLYGANEVHAFDLDEGAIKVSLENQALNPFAESVQFHVNDLLMGVSSINDVIVANILPDILTRFVTDAWRCLKTGGKLILSGILIEKAPSIITLYEEVGFEFIQMNQSGDWSALLFKKPGA